MVNVNYIYVVRQKVRFPGGARFMEETMEKLKRGRKEHELPFAYCACLHQVILHLISTTLQSFQASLPV